MAYMAKALIESGGNDHKREILNFEEYKRCANLYNEAQSGGDLESWGIPEWEAFFLGTSYQQFPTQANQDALIPRTLRIYTELANRANHRRNFDIPSAFEKLTGLTVREFVAIGFWIWAVKCQRPSDSPFFRAADFVRSDVPLAQQAKIEAFFQHTSTTYPDFRRTADSVPEAGPQAGVYAANQLEWKPIVRTQF
jgi:hypothetical protein